MQWPDVSTRGHCAAVWQLKSSVCLVPWLASFMECFCISRRVCGSGSVPSNTGLLLRRSSASPSQQSEDPGLWQVAGSPAGLLGKTGLWGRQDSVLATEVKLSWDESASPKLQLRTGSLRGLGQVPDCEFPSNTGLLQFSGVDSPPSSRLLSEKTGLLRETCSPLRSGLLGNVRLLQWAGKDFSGVLSWELHTVPECTRSWLSRDRRTSALQ